MIQMLVTTTSFSNYLIFEGEIQNFLCMLIHKETIASISGKWKLKADACIVRHWRVLPTPVVSNQKELFKALDSTNVY